MDTLFVFKANLSHRSLTNVLSCRISFLLEFQKLQSDSESKMHEGIPLGFGMYNRVSQTKDTLPLSFPKLPQFFKVEFPTRELPSFEVSY